MIKILQKAKNKLTKISRIIESTDSPFLIILSIKEFEIHEVDLGEMNFVVKQSNIKGDDTILPTDEIDVEKFE